VSDVVLVSFGAVSAAVGVVSLAGTVHGEELIFAPNPNEFNYH